jgi:putative endonuclease
MRYVGDTHSLKRRIWQHKTGMIPRFTTKYALKTLVYAEEYRDVSQTIARAKALKGWLGVRKTELIRTTPPLWRDLAADGYQLPMVASPASAGSE